MAGAIGAGSEKRITGTPRGFVPYAVCVTPPEKFAEP